MELELETVRSINGLKINPFCTGIISSEHGKEIIAIGEEIYVGGCKSCHSRPSVFCMQRAPWIGSIEKYEFTDFVYHYCLQCFKKEWATAYRIESKELLTLINL